MGCQYSFESKLLKRFKLEQLTMDPKDWSEFIKNPDIITGLSEEEITRLKQLRRRKLGVCYSQCSRDKNKEKGKAPSKTISSKRNKKPHHMIKKKVLLQNRDDNALRKKLKLSTE